MLAARQGIKADQGTGCRTAVMPALDLNALTHLLYEASLAPNPARFACAVDRFLKVDHGADHLAFEAVPRIARQLGDSWVNDQISFADVTIGCARLQSVLHQLPDSDPATRNATTSNPRRSHCLVIVPEGAQHTLGALVLAKQLRHAGQGVTVALKANQNVLSDLRKSHDFKTILISASRSECIETLHTLVSMTHRMWAQSTVVIGGTVCNQGRDLRAATQADHVTNDWQEALALCK